MPQRPSRLPTLLLLAALGGAMGGCASVDRVVVGSTTPDDMRQRHPIVLANAPQTLDIFVADRGRLDRRQERDLKAFAEGFRAGGQGMVSILVPRVDGRSLAAEQTLTSVRHALSRNGLGGAIQLGSYPVGDAALAAPIRLAYAALEARVGTRCGEWPSDLASGSSLRGLENRPYYNLGCATQQNLAAQIADPRDLVRPRVEDPSDVVMRTRAIGFVRQGAYPGTIWTTRSTPLGEVVP